MLVTTLFFVSLRSMEILTTIIESYGIAAVVLMLLILLLFIVQIVQQCRYFIVSRFKLAARPRIREEQTAVSVVVPLFGEDEEYLKGDFRILLGQSCANYEVVAVYVGKEDAFYATLRHMRKFYPHLKTTQIDYSPQYPVTMKMALNIGIKSATHECVVLTTPETRPTTLEWVDFIARGFMFGDIVLGYCNWEQKRGLKNLFYRKYRFSEGRTALTEAICGRQYDAFRNCVGFTKQLYFSVRGFDHLDLTAGEDDLFVQRIATKNNVSVMLTPPAHCSEREPDSVHNWLTEIYRRGQTRRFYTRRARNAEACEQICRVAFFVAAIGGLVALPLELKAAIAFFILTRYIIVGLVNYKTAKRVGESKIAAWGPLFDLLEPWVRLFIRTTQPQRIYKWR